MVATPNYLAAQSRRVPGWVDRCLAYARGLSFKSVVLCALVGGFAFAYVPPRAYTVVLTWDPSGNTEIVAHRIYYGETSGEYGAPLEVGNVSTALVPGLTGGRRYYFAVTAVHRSGQESEYSDEISFIPGPRTIRIAPAAPADLATPGAPAAPGSPLITIHGVPGQYFDVEATDDFETWTVVATVRIEANGCVEFEDTDVGQYPRRFYRTRLLE